MSPRADTRWWIPVPAWVVPVRWCADAESELDALELAVLALLRNTPRTIDELVERLGVGDDVVLSALLDLADHALVEPPAHVAGLWVASGEDSPAGADLASGLAFITAHDEPRAVPRVVPPSWTSARAASRVPGPALDPALVRDAEIERPRRGLVEACLARAVGRGAMACPPPRDVGGRTDAPAATLVRLDPLDASGREARWQRGVLWSAVDVLPGLGGDATLVFHEPDPEPDREAETPVSTALEEWVRAQAPALARELDERVRALAIDRSVVLRAAGLASLEEVDALVRTHRAELAGRIGIALPEAWPAPLAEAAKSLDEASRWLMMARREPAYTAALLRCQAAAVEALAQALWGSVAGVLREWAEVWRPRLGAGGLSKVEKKERYSADAARRRLASLELSRRLGPSEAHLIEATESLKPTLKAIEVGAPGAGEGVALWLLPLTLLEPDPARAHAARVSRALAANPYLFDHLAALIDARNVIVHQREAADDALARRPEDLELRLLQVAAALAAGLTA